MKNTEIHLPTAGGVVISIHDHSAGGSYDSGCGLSLYILSLWA